MADPASGRLRAVWRLTDGVCTLPDLLLTYASVRLGLRRRSLAELSGRPPLASPDGDAGEVGTQLERLRHLTDLVLLRRPFRSGCLVRALVLQELLRRRGIAARLVITVARTAGGLRAHAETRLRPAGDPAPILMEQRS